MPVPRHDTSGSLPEPTVDPLELLAHESFAELTQDFGIERLMDLLWSARGAAEPERGAAR